MKIPENSNIKLPRNFDNIVVASRRVFTRNSQNFTRQAAADLNVSLPLNSTLRLARTLANEASALKRNILSPVITLTLFEDSKKVILHPLPDSDSCAANLIPTRGIMFCTSRSRRLDLQWAHNKAAEAKDQGEAFGIRIGHGSQGVAQKAIQKKQPR